MSLFHRAAPNLPAQDFIPRRPPASPMGTAIVTNDTALRHSAVWAACRLRANLVSTMPVDTFRRVNGIQVEQKVTINPGGTEVPLHEWIYSTQFDLDRAGNTFGIVTERWTSSKLPARIELVPLSAVSIIGKGSRIVQYRIAGELYDPADVWHERQYTVAGMPLGLSPVAYAAWSIGEYLSIQDFAMSWFGTGAVPKAHLRNNALKTIVDEDAQAIKDRFKASVTGGDVFVSGADWEYSMIQAEQTGTEWIEAKKYSIADIARFFDVPGDLIDAETSSGSITYANVTQRNLQFLIMHLGPAVYRREQSLGNMLPKPLYIKFNVDSLLRMDPMTRSQVLKTQIDSRTVTPDEARELENRGPLTQADTDQFLTFWPPRGTVEKGAPLESATQTSNTGDTPNANH